MKSGPFTALGTHIPELMSQKSYIAPKHPAYKIGTDYDKATGTSVSTPIVAGALMREANPDLAPDEVKYRLMASAKPAINIDQYGNNVSGGYVWSRGYAWSEGHAWTEATSLAAI